MVAKWESNPEVDKRKWLQNRTEDNKQHTSHELTNTLLKPSRWEGFLDEKTIQQNDESFEATMPWNSKKIWNNSYSISNSLQTWEHIPAAFWVDWVVVWQRIDMKLYLSIIQESTRYLKKVEDKYISNHWVPMNEHQRCQAAMHSISHYIAMLLRPWQDDRKYKEYIDSVVTSWSTLLDPEKIRQLEIENCLLKSAIAHQFLNSVWFTTSRFLLSGELQHAYVEVDIGHSTLRIDANSPESVPVPKQLQNELWPIFHSANISGDIIHDITLVEYNQASLN
jgi:hypothetical protein